jgi:hypothetical protein
VNEVLRITAQLRVDLIRRVVQESG